MAAYGTPGYDYTKGTNQLAKNKGFGDAANDYGRFISQQKFRRQREDAGTQMRRKFPKVGGHFQNRGMWNSGLRQQGQRQFLGDYNRDVQRSLQDQQVENQGFDLRQAMDDSTYQDALVDLYDRWQAGRMNTDPFTNVYLPGS